MRRCVRVKTLTETPSVWFEYAKVEVCFCIVCKTYSIFNRNLYVVLRTLAKMVPLKTFYGQRIFPPKCILFCAIRDQVYTLLITRF